MHILILTGLLLLIPTAGAAEALVPLPSQPAQIAWPSVAWPEAGLAPSVDSRALAVAVRTIFESGPVGGLPDTRALLVVQGGEIVLERYAEGFGPDSRFHAWSMAKSFVQCLVAILVRDGLLELNAPVPVPTWSEADDPRHRLTLHHRDLHPGLDPEAERSACKDAPGGSATLG